MTDQTDAVTTIDDKIEHAHERTAQHFTMAIACTILFIAFVASEWRTFTSTDTVDKLLDAVVAIVNTAAIVFFAGRALRHNLRHRELLAEKIAPR